MKVLIEKFLLEEDSFKDVELEGESQEETEDTEDTVETPDEDIPTEDTTETTEETPEEPATTTYKVSFQLGGHENWSRYEAVSEEEAAKAVEDYVTKKWPNREFKIINIEKFENVEESLVENLNDVSRDFKEGDIVFVKPSKKTGKVIKVNGEYIDVEISGEKDPDRIDTFYPSDLELKMNEDLDTVPEEGPVEGPEAGLASSINSAIQDELKTVDIYNSLAITARSEGFEDIAMMIDEINTEENKHIGQLQEALKTISPNASAIEDGKVEGEEQLSNPNINKTETITEDIDDLSQDEFIKFKDCIKDNLNMSWKEFIVAYEGHKLPIQDVNSLEDVPGEYIELGNTDLSQGTGNVIVYTMLSLEDGQLYRYVSY
jgi:hypothetical protein